MVSIIIYCLIILAGVLSGCFFGVKSPVIVFADHVADLFVLCLKWLGIPLVSLSILTTTVNLKDQQELFYLGKRVLKYTLLTTISAASIALILFLLIDPASSMVANFDNLSELSKENFTETASIASNNIFGMLIIGSIVATMVLSFILLALPEQSKQGAKKLLLWLYEKTMLLVNSCLMLMPIAIWAFVALLCIELKNLSITSLILYLSCIVLANLIQAIIVLPIFLKYKNLSVKQTFRGFLPSLMVAFWSKSSAVALPTAIHCATEKIKNFTKNCEIFVAIVHNYQHECMCCFYFDHGVVCQYEPWYEFYTIDAWSLDLNCNGDSHW